MLALIATPIPLVSYIAQLHPCSGFTFSIFLTLCLPLQVGLNMLKATYVALCEKAFYGSGIAGACITVSLDPYIEVMTKDPNIECWTAPHTK